MIEECAAKRVAVAWKEAEVTGERREVRGGRIVACIVAASSCFQSQAIYKLPCLSSCLYVFWLGKIAGKLVFVYRPTERETGRGRGRGRTVWKEFKIEIRKVSKKAKFHKKFYYKLLLVCGYFVKNKSLIVSSIK